ncbi:tyrosine-protein phosphatase [Haloimpatiens sp. FM7315]|uniref:tyrosine-protein phosphatase n=1 Tax=Haloimpatiens sp. FM7315 TaxID=3298609 RepID=UPI00370BB16F
MIDVHCHILPSVDDGSKDMETSIEMAKIAYEDGIRKIIATPHYYRGYFENKFCDVKAKVKELNEELKNREIQIEVIEGQEIFLDSHTLEMFKKGDIGPINNKKYMLLELDFAKFQKSAIETLYELKIKGITPIIAHPERYMYFWKDIREINYLIEEGCLFQINAGSITGLYGKEAQKTAKILIEKGICNFLGTDAHSVGRRKPKLKEAYSWVEENHRDMYLKLLENAENLINGKDIELNNKKIEEKKGFLRKIFGR